MLFKMTDVGWYKLLHNSKLNGVKNMANRVENAVRLIDKAVFPLANFVMKLEMFPPGQAATKNMPKAMLAGGFIILTKKNVKAGNKMNCDKKPIIKGFGFTTRSLKSVSFTSSATPNIMMAKLRFSNQTLS